MHEKTTPLEKHLRSLKLPAKSSEDAMLFYRCGFEAAQAAKPEPPVVTKARSWQTFCRGLGSGIAASVFILACWLHLTPATSPSVSDVQVAEQTPIVGTTSDPVAEETDVSDDALPLTADQLAEIGRLEIGELFPWKWPTAESEEKLDARSLMPLSPASNAQWVSLIEEIVSDPNGRSL